MPDTVDHLHAPPCRDWETLAHWLKADWRAACADEPEERDPFCYRAGYMELASIIGRLMRQAAPEDREAVLYQFLSETLSCPGPDEDNPD